MDRHLDLPRARRRRGHRARLGVVLASVLFASGPVGSAAAQNPATQNPATQNPATHDPATHDPATGHSEVRAERDALADELDVLRATDAEVVAALDDLDTAIADQEHIVSAARLAVTVATTTVRDAERALAQARVEIDLLEAAITRMAIASYVHPPSADLVQSLQASTLSDAVVQQTYLDARADRDLDLLDQLAAAEARAIERTAAVAEASERARVAADDARGELAGLERERQRQAAFADDVRGRIDGALAEAAVLADLDAEISARIAAEQAALIARLPDPTPPPTVPPTPVPAPTTTLPPVPVTTTAPDEGEETTTSSTTSSTTTTRPDESDDDTDDTTRTTDSPPLVTVRGITVHADIGAEVEAMLVAAEADGVDLSGSGYRSAARQIQLRRAHCGPTEYDIWYKPASSCRPPTAPPGRSLHERGLAIDMLHEGRLIRSRSNEGFQWLADNAGDYGFSNLPSEPWHWSTTGG